MRVIEKVFLKTISRESMLPEGSCITAAVSGGADSVAMLYLLYKFAPARKWTIDVLHINHGLREDSASDESFVGNLAGQLGMVFTCKTPSVDSTGSMESRWSRTRQAIYEKMPGIVTVAHTASDRAETLLMRLFEGAGLRGLGGMDYTGVGPVRRPLLDITGKELRSWLNEKGLKWIEDSSNRDTDISRNRLRLEVMPIINENFPEAVNGICRSGSLLSSWRDLQDQLFLFSEENNSISRLELFEMPGVLAGLTLWQMAGQPRSGFQEFHKVLNWLKKGGKGNHILPGGKRLVADSEEIFVEERGTGRY